MLVINNTFIETDCILIGGDSGGPLFDMEGRVVGIHSRIGSQLSKNLHVPVNAYRDSWDRLVRGDAWGSLLNLVGRPVIGVLGDRNTEVPRIAQVLPASPAESAGLKPGDLVSGLETTKSRSSVISRIWSAGGTRVMKSSSW